MRRYGNLWNDVVSFEALPRAAEQARKGKRFRPSVAAFDFDPEHELLKLQDELRTLTYRPGAYRSFFIDEPKKRQISAAPYPYRVVHHAQVNELSHGLSLLQSNRPSQRNTCRQRASVALNDASKTNPNSQFCG